MEGCFFIFSSYIACSLEKPYFWFLYFIDSEIWSICSREKSSKHDIFSKSRVQIFLKIFFLHSRILGTNHQIIIFTNCSLLDYHVYTSEAFTESEMLRGVGDSEFEMHAARILERTCFDGQSVKTLKLSALNQLIAPMVDVFFLSLV